MNRVVEIKNLFPQLPFISIKSDTEGRHNEIKLVSGNLLIHCGDVTEYGMQEELEDFIEWFSRQDYRYKIFIGGNHDLCLENLSLKEKKKIFSKEVIYLENKSVIIEGVKIFGSPFTPYYYGMAFNKKRGKEIKEVWRKIPKDTQILITHGPPQSILDADLGCEDLLKKVKSVKPTLHAFGHIHEAAGIQKEEGILFVNASNLFAK